MKDKKIQLEEVLKNIEKKFKSARVRGLVFRYVKRFIFALLAVAFTGGISYAGYTFYASNSFEDNYDKITDGLVLDINLSENNYVSSTKTFSDNSGSENDGVSINSASFTLDNYGNSSGAMSFDGSSDYIICGTDADSFALGDGDHAFETWVNPASIAGTDYQYIIAFGDNKNGNQSGIGIRDSGIFHSAYAVPIINSTYKLPGIDRWYHIVVVSSGGVDSLYINGEWKENQNIAINTTVGKCRIGAHTGDDSINLNGSIASVKIFNRFLSSDEVATLYNSSKDGLVLDLDLSEDNYESSSKTFYDKSGLGNHGTSTNSAIFSADRQGKTGEAISFNGVNDYISVVDNANLSFGNGVNDEAFSIGAWINTKDNTLSQGIVTKYSAGGKEWIFRLVGGKLQFFVQDNSESAYRGRYYDTAVDADTWHYLSAVYDGEGLTSSIKLYLNGVRVDDTSVSSGAYIAMEDLDKSVIIGAVYAGSSFFYGDISSVKIYNKVLSADEITNLYNDSKPKVVASKSKKGLVGHWPLDKESLRSEGTVNYVANPLFESAWLYQTYEGNACDIEYLVLDGIPTMHLYNVAQPTNDGYPRIVDNFFSSSITGDIAQSIRIKSKNGAGQIQFKIYEDASTKITQAINPTSEFITYKNIFNTAFNLNRPYIQPDVGDEYYVQYPQVENKSEVSPFVDGTRIDSISDLTPYDNHGDIYGATFTTDQKRQIDRAMYFDGTDDYIELGDVESSNTMSWAFRIKTTSGNTERIFDKYSTAGVTRSWRIYIDGAERISLQISSDGTNYESHLTSNPILLDEWQDIIMTFDEGVFKVYINGLEVSVDSDFTFTSIFDNSYNVLVGKGHVDDSTNFKGSISDFRIYNRVLSSDEVTSYHGSYRPKISAGSLQKGLVGYWGLKNKDEKVGDDLVGTYDFTSDWGDTGSTIISSNSFITNGGSGVYKTYFTVGKSYRLWVKGTFNFADYGVYNGHVPDSRTLLMDGTAVNTGTWVDFIAEYPTIYFRDGSSEVTTVNEFIIKELKTGDLTPYDNHGSVYGATVASSYTEFDGVDDRIITTANTSLGLATYTWWSKSSKTTRNTVFGHGGVSTGVFSYNYTGDNALLYLSGSNYKYFYDTDETDDGRWHFYSLIITGAGQDNITDAKFYIDSVEKTNVLVQKSATPNTFLEGLVIGDQDSSGGIHSFEGEMSNFRVYNRSLSTEEIDLLYSKGR